MLYPMMPKYSKVPGHTLSILAKLELAAVISLDSITDKVKGNGFTVAPILNWLAVSFGFLQFP